MCGAVCLLGLWVGCVGLWAGCGAVFWGCVGGLVWQVKAPPVLMGGAVWGCGCGCGYCLGVVTASIKLNTMQAPNNKPAVNIGLLKLKYVGNKIFVGIAFTFVCVGGWAVCPPAYCVPAFTCLGLC